MTLLSTILQDGLCAHIKESQQLQEMSEAPQNFQLFTSFIILAVLVLPNTEDLFNPLDYIIVVKDSVETVYTMSEWPSDPQRSSLAADLPFFHVSDLMLSWMDNVLFVIVFWSADWKYSSRFMAFQKYFEMKKVFILRRNHYFKISAESESILLLITDSRWMHLFSFSSSVQLSSGWHTM